MNAMYEFVFDLMATILEQYKPGSHASSTKWLLGFPYFAQALLMSRQLDSQGYIDIPSVDHVTAGVVLRSQIESIAYRRDLTAVRKGIPEEPDTIQSGDIYGKIALLASTLAGTK